MSIIHNNKTDEKCSENNTNTIEPTNLRKVVWCFTSFEVDLLVNGDKIENGEKLKKVFKYFCFSPEVCPNTGRHHFQGYFSLLGKNGLSRSSIKKKINSSWHLIPANGTSEQNRIYCGGGDYEKNGKVKKRNPLFFECGELPLQGKRTDLNELKKSKIKKIAKKNLILDCQNSNMVKQENIIDLKELHEEIKKGKTVKEIRLENPKIYDKYARTLNMLEDDHVTKKFRTEMPKCTWHWGKTGVGKSHKVLKDFDPDNDYLLNIKDGGFWKDYEGQKR